MITSLLFIEFITNLWYLILKVSFSSYLLKTSKRHWLFQNIITHCGFNSPGAMVKQIHMTYPRLVSCVNGIHCLTCITLDNLNKGIENIIGIYICKL